MTKGGQRWDSGLTLRVASSWNQIRIVGFVRKWRMKWKKCVETKLNLALGVGSQCVLLSGQIAMTSFQIPLDP